MYDIQTFTGRIIELRRFMNRVPRLTDHDPSRERWEVWLAAPDSTEHKFLVWSRFMPARVGHAVHLLHVHGASVALYNLDTGERVNFTRADPALLFRMRDSAVLAFGGVACMAIGAGAGQFALMAALSVELLYLPLMVLCRFMSRTTLQRQVDSILDEIQVDNVVRPFRRRT